MDIDVNIKYTYEDDYYIYSPEKLESLIDDKGYIKHDVNIKGDRIKSLGRLKKVYGNLGISSDSLCDLGELNYVKGDMWVSGDNLFSLGKLERVGGSLSLNGSKIISLGKLWRIGDKLNLRDTDIYDLSSLKKVKTLFLLKRLKDVDIDFIETDKVKYWNDLRQENLPELHDLELELKKRQFTGRVIVKDVHLLNDFIQRNINDFYSFLDDKLDDIYGENYSLFYSLYDELKKQQKTDKGYLSHDKFYSFLYSLPFQSQNEFRVSKGIPEIGEGWVSETELYYLLKGEFYNEEVIHHGKPKWLGRQHVDIWFPKHKIGIEYQGLQHDQPVEFFGGEESFIKGQQRDLKKKKLFKENNSILIEVRKGYNIEDVVNEIKKNIT